MPDAAYFKKNFLLHYYIYLFQSAMLHKMSLTRLIDSLGVGEIRARDGGKCVHDRADDGR